MKSWIYAMMGVTAAAMTVFAGCSSGGSGGTSTGGEGGGGGEGGSGATSTTTTTTTTTTSTTTSTTTTTTTMPDCTQEADFGACADCFAQQYPDGAQVYNDLVVCVICGACYTVCDGANSGCPMAPPMKDACDGDAADMTACGDSMSGCIQCGLGGSCSDELSTCQMNQDCVDFATAIGDCPQ